MRERPRPLQVYRHFKGTYYQVVDVAVHTETGEEFVIYRPLFGEGKTFARPLDMFLSETDMEKYPDARQKYRFVAADGEDNEKKKEPGDNSGEDDARMEETKADILSESPFEEGVIDKDLECFLDAKSYDKKIDHYLLLRKKITAEMLETIAISLDIQLSGEDIDAKYNEVLECLKTKRKYESDRLR
ncbi:MAG: DUF1653 domain-containing protein [Lachnospiraceae bacterium]|nr:DUF1653 domain-containing protein [Lachnospiraceae bacterium]